MLAIKEAAKEVAYRPRVHQHSRAPGASHRTRRPGTVHESTAPSTAQSAPREVGVRSAPMSSSPVSPSDGRMPRAPRETPTLRPTMSNLQWILARSRCPSSVRRPHDHFRGAQRRDAPLKGPPTEIEDLLRKWVPIARRNSGGDTAHPTLGRPWHRLWIPSQVLGWNDRISPLRRGYDRRRTQAERPTRRGWPEG